MPSLYLLHTKPPCKSVHHNSFSHFFLGDLMQFYHVSSFSARCSGKFWCIFRIAWEVSQKRDRMQLFVFSVIPAQFSACFYPKKRAAQRAALFVFPLSVTLSRWPLYSAQYLPRQKKAARMGGLFSRLRLQISAARASWRSTRCSRRDGQTWARREPSPRRRRQRR